jgi:hypothetical protein
MLRIALIVGIIGLGVLIGMLLMGPKQIASLDGLNVGEVVEVNGVVEEEREFGNGKLLLINEIPIYCECNEEYIGEEVIVEGIVEKFPEDLRIKVFRIKNNI